MPGAHRGRERRYLALLSGAVLVASLFSVVPAVTRGSSSDGQIAFVRGAGGGGDSDIWVINADGSSETQLTSGSARDESPAWSPDGSTLAFARTIGSSTGIWLIEADGSNLRPLTIQTDLGQFVQAARPQDWHAGQLLATVDYVDQSCGSGGGPSVRRLVLIDVATGATTSVAGGGCFSFSVGHAAFSPDGSQVVYDENFGSPWIKRLDLTTGTGEILISNAYAPDWSPIDDRLAFVDQNVFNVAVRELDGSISHHALGGTDPHWAPDATGLVVSGLGSATGTVIRVFDFSDHSTDDLTDGTTDDSDPAWAPGSVTATPPTPAGPGKIAYATQADGSSEIFGINDDGSHQVRLTTDPGRDEDPVWSPDGARIAFASDRGGITGMWVMNADGTDLREINPSTPNGGISSFVPTDWSPDGTLLVGSGQVFNSFCNGGFGNPIVQSLIVDLETESATPLTGNPCASTTDGTINRDGTQAAWVQFDGIGSAIYRGPLDQSTPGERVSSEQHAGDPMWSPVDDRIGYVADNQVKIASAPGSTQIVDSGTEFDWSPNGQSMAIARLGGLSYEIQIVSLVGEPASTVATSPSSISGLSWASGQMVDLAPPPSETPQASASESPPVSEEPSMSPTPLPTPEPTSDPDTGGDEGVLFNIEAGGLQTTDFSFDGAEVGDPLEVSVMTPNAGSVGIQESSATTQAPAAGYQLLGQEVTISAPPATAATPVAIDFILDASLVAGAPIDRIAVQSNGVKVPACIDAGGSTADPAPCVLPWRSGGGDDVVLTVRTVQASTWNVIVGLPIDPESVTVTAPAGGTVTTDTEGDGADAADPLETTVESPIGGTIEIEESDPFGATPTGWEFVGQQVEVTADPATAEEPLVLTFRLDASLLPIGATATTVQLFRDGALIIDCDPGSGGSAVPDPCLALRTVLPDGDVSLTARSSHASAWNLGIYEALDTTAPTVLLEAPGDAAAYLLGTPAVANYRCLDVESGVVECNGTEPDGATLPTDTVGPHTFEVLARDGAGNTVVASVSYTVVYDFAGWLAPIGNRPTLNQVRAGSAVPVKFSLGGDQGLAVLASGYPKVATMDCAGGTVEPVEMLLSTTANAGLTYDAATGTYVYVWKTQKGWSNSCRTLIVRMADGSEHRADFSFVR